ncbi:MAG: type II toxin-antitoxin system VapC family toxin [Chloroflexota bacterium]
MTDYLMDTNHLSPLVTSGHPLRRRFFLSQQAGHTFALAVPALTETLLGITLLPRSKQNLTEWQRVMPGLTMYDLDQADAERAAQLQLQLRRRGWQLATVDAFIAAVALRYNLTLLTSDKDFAVIPRLNQENWLEAIVN